MKKSVHISERAVEAIEFNGAKAEGEGISSRLNDILDRYAAIMSVTEHGLSDAEMDAVYAAHSGHIFGPADLDINLHWPVEDAIASGEAAKWPVDGDALVEKLEVMSQAQRVLVIELIERRQAAAKAEMEAVVGG